MFEVSRRTACGPAWELTECLYIRVRPLKNGSTDPSIYRLNARDGILSFEAHHPIAVKRMGMNKGSAPKHEFQFGTSTVSNPQAMS